MLPVWSAPRVEVPLDAVVTLPGSKSQTNRELVLSALADGPSRLTAPLRARDTELMATALSALGVIVRDDGPDWLVEPAGALTGAAIGTGLAGTVMRFVPPLACLATGSSRFDGDAAARIRPMSTLLGGLRQLGADIDDDGRGTLPFTVEGAGSLTGGRAEIDSAASSQFVSALLLAGARFDKGLDLRHVGPRPVPSQTHLTMTVDALRDRGVEVDTSTLNAWSVAPGAVGARDVDIEPDLSNAAPFLAAALVTGGRVVVRGWPGSTSQAGDALRTLLTAFGGHVNLTDGGLEVRGGDGIAGVDLDLSDVGELTPVLAALAALASGPSRLRGVAHLRGHETDRLAALTTELRALGGDVDELDDGLVIRPRPLSGAVWHSYADHRMAQAGALLGLAVEDLGVEDIETTTKTMADFPERWAALTAGIA